MTSRHFVDFDVDGSKRFAHFDDETGDLLAIEREEDVESVLNWAKGRYNEGLADSRCEFRQVGSYPWNTIVIFAKKHGLDPKRVMKEIGPNKQLTELLISDPDLSKFQTLHKKLKSH